MQNLVQLPPRSGVRTINGAWGSLRPTHYGLIITYLFLTNRKSSIARLEGMLTSI